MQTKIVLFDIDYTLFNNDHFVDLKDQQIIKTIGIVDITRYKRILPKYLSSLPNARDFKPEVFINLVCAEFKFENKEVLNKLAYNDPKLYKESLFDDALPTISRLYRTSKIGIFSEAADIEFQIFKLKSFALDNYISSDLIFIVPAKDNLEVINKLPKDVVVVDDKESICNFLFDNGIECIWLNRKDERKSDKYKTIFSLLELPAILKVDY